jgi:hypothetical protein
MLHNATKTNPLSWRPHITKLNDQSDASYLEHLHTTQVLQQSIDNYIAAGTSSPSCIIIIGGPGTGKTFQLKQACLYALSQGLNVLTTAVMSERAIVLGCRHLHYLFCIPGHDSQNIHQLSDSIIYNLNRKPAFLYVLETNDAIFIDDKHSRQCSSICTKKKYFLWWNDGVYNYGCTATSTNTRTSMFGIIISSY